MVIDHKWSKRNDYIESHLHVQVSMFLQTLDIGDGKKLIYFCLPVNNVVASD